MQRVGGWEVFAPSQPATASSSAVSSEQSGFLAGHDLPSVSTRSIKYCFSAARALDSRAPRTPALSSETSSLYCSGGRGRGGRGAERRHALCPIHLVKLVSVALQIGVAGVATLMTSSDNFVRFQRVRTYLAILETLKVLPFVSSSNVALSASGSSISCTRTIAAQLSAHDCADSLHTKWRQTHGMGSWRLQRERSALER